MKWKEIQKLSLELLKEFSLLKKKKILDKNVKFKLWKTKEKQW